MTERLLNWPGKSPIAEGGPTHPAVYHMLDVAAVAEILLATFPLSRPLISALILLTALHDLGKVNERFRRALLDGLPQGKWTHWHVTEALLLDNLFELSELLDADEEDLKILIAACAGHHGQPTYANSRERSSMLRSAGADARGDAGEVLRQFHGLWPDASLAELTHDDVVSLSWWVPGLIATADWIGSNATWFEPFDEPLVLPDYLKRVRPVARRAIEEAGLSTQEPQSAPVLDAAWTLRPMQQACQEIALPEGPMLALIEDETGAGKTEAALILAQRMLLAGKAQGVFFALPTMATANAMFARVSGLVSKLFAGPASLALAHGRASLFKGYRELLRGDARDEDSPNCTQWMADDRRRALLANIGVGTIDQGLLAALPCKHNTLRHFALSSKILIVDEVHDMGDPYMAELLAQLLRMHRAAGGSAILLTATLPMVLREKLFEAWGETAPVSESYPALSVAGGESKTDFPQETAARGVVAVQRLESDQEAEDLIVQRAQQGAACLWVRNAVDDAIAAVQHLREAGIHADLLHARFTMADRITHETAALERFGKNGRDRAGRVLVATQVVESSLDLDFDVMVTDLAPVPAMVQRAGRLWRHMDLRPAAQRPVSDLVLHVLSPDPAAAEDEQWLARILGGGAWTYPLATQWRSARALFERGQINAPLGLRDLIEAAEKGDVPAVLEQSDLERMGREFAESGQAQHSMIDLNHDYRGRAQAKSAKETPTRLGREQMILVLAREEGDGLMPWAQGDGVAQSWALSEVSASARRLHALDLPDQSAPGIAKLTADWPEWKRAEYRLCPVGEGGRICEGLVYCPLWGLVFE